ncbi:hypothetical protein [Maribellus maritimus]|uniref:hypothetical protein n=1 Tax=Maribellus maritimus TaxID=2870838 RepID=UPI001EEB93E7|nr:hypothetical protein [Maribellus maritimus]MCG6188072.1 hypothetical protein [Maribellus maritimus]
MKPVKNFVLIGLTLFIVTGCDELIKKNVDVPITFEVFQEIDKQETNEQNPTFSFEGYFDILSHPDVANAIGTPDKIKKIKITKIQYEFRNFEGDVDAVINGKIYLPEEKSVSDPSPEYYTYSIPPVKVAESVLLKELYTLDGYFNKVNDYLTETTVFEYSFHGYSSHYPVNFYMVLHVSATVSVEASIDYKGNYN